MDLRAKGMIAAGFAAASIGIWAATRLLGPASNGEVVHAVQAPGAPEESGVEFGELERVPIAGEVEGGPTTETSMAEYFGEDWEEMRKAYLAAGQEQYFDGEPLTPWEDVSDEFRHMLFTVEPKKEMFRRQLFDWQEDKGWVVEEFGGSEGLSDETYFGVVDLASGYNFDMQILLENYCTDLQRALDEAWTSKGYERVPLTTEVLDMNREHQWYREPHALWGTGSHGWCVRVTISREDYPHLTELREAIRSKAKDRDRALREYVKSQR